MMIHSVFFWLTDDGKLSQREFFDAEVKKLAQIDCIAQAYTGTPAATKPRSSTDHSWDIALHFHFDSIEDHDAYQVHPAHDAFIEACKPLWSRALVIDTETDA